MSHMLPHLPQNTSSRSLFHLHHLPSDHLLPHCPVLSRLILDWSMKTLRDPRRSGGYTESAPPTGYEPKIPQSDKLEVLRNWCLVCVISRRREERHRKRQKRYIMSLRVWLDTFLWLADDMVVMLTLRGEESGATEAAAVTEKDVNHACSRRWTCVTSSGDCGEADETRGHGRDRQATVRLLVQGACAECTTVGARLAAHMGGVAGETVPDDSESEILLFCGGGVRHCGWSSHQTQHLGRWVGTRTEKCEDVKMQVRSPSCEKQFYSTCRRQKSIVGRRARCGDAVRQTAGAYSDLM